MRESSPLRNHVVPNEHLSDHIPSAVCQCQPESVARRTVSSQGSFDFTYYLHQILLLDDSQAKERAQYLTPHRSKLLRLSLARVLI